MRCTIATSILQTFISQEHDNLKASFDPATLIEGMVGRLDEKARKVVSARAGLTGSKKTTLSQIGGELHLSRERIRQIERDAFVKLSDRLHTGENTAIQFVVTTLDSQGGVMHESALVDMVLAENRRSATDINALRLFLRLTKDLVELKESKTMRQGWALRVVATDSIYRAIGHVLEFILQHSKVADFENIWNHSTEFQNFPKQFLMNTILLSKEIISTGDNNFGLASWATINPRNVRDKIYFVLHESGEPLHFTDITKRIREQGFDTKKIVQPTVHNELIADDRFVLVGRGIYALSHWGYKPGTVEEVIEEVLKKAKRPLSTDEIVTEVLKSRHVKKNTIIINLQIKPQFVKVGKKLYSITPATAKQVSADAKKTLEIAEAKA